MNKFISLFLALCFFKCEAQWTDLGITGFTNSNGYYPLFALDTSGIPTLLGNIGSYIVSKKFQANEWITTDSSDIGGWEVSALAFDKNNHPYVALTLVPNGMGKVMEFKGGAWIAVSDTFYSPYAGFPDLSLAVYDSLVYILYDSYYTHGVTVSVSNGTNPWSNVGDTIIPSTGNTSAQLSLDKSGTPYVIYTGLPTVKKFDGSSWMDIGTPNLDLQGANWFKLGLDNNNVPYAAMFGDGTDGIRISKFDGTNWNMVGTTAFCNLFDDGTGNGGFDLAFDMNNTLLFAYAKADTVNFPSVDKANVIAFVNGNWRAIGNTDFSAGTCDFPHMLVDQDNTIYVSYYDESYSQMVVQKYAAFTGIKEVAIERPQLYPNPSGTTFTITNVMSGSLLTVYNMLGEPVLKQMTKGDKTVIDISDFPSGIYIVNGAKFIKQ